MMNRICNRKGIRPDFCNTYPDNIFDCVDAWNTQKIQVLIDNLKKDCPAAEHITVKDVQDMLERKRQE